MWFESPFFLMDSISGIVLILCGIVLRIWPPKKINNYYGYRSKLAKKSQRHWQYAQKYCANESMLQGTLLFIISWFGVVWKANEYWHLLAGFVFIFGTTWLAYKRTEKAIRKLPRY